ncbi:hypothetical protein ASG31_07625 [Chryseobacterium sp. Leaf404]|uniref:hypothetical protein n=1 Tax=unclassified Chryseobacterium TaxID=2593645 RepID=UPI0006F9DD75|nr:MULTISPECIES: hypothetical protein [unclassified Chryseobacterium]KQT18576.1 hypothetical protein ASG31_07625 [Chryseobacterium sp. Leaf404]
MKNLLLLFSVFTLIGCKKNPNRIEEMNANGGKNYIKKHFKNNSKVKLEVFDKETDLVITETDFKDSLIVKLIEYYPNKKPKIIAKILKNPNVFNGECYLENGKKESEGSFFYNYKKGELVRVSDWIFYNPNTQEADSICNYFSNGDISVLTKVDRVSSDKIVTIQYFKIKNSKNSNELEIEKVQ